MRYNISFLHNPYVKCFRYASILYMDFGDCVSITDFICINVYVSLVSKSSLSFTFSASLLSHALSLTLSHSIPYTNGLIPYALNVIPLDLFCLSGISCRVIDYGQFSKHPTANTWSISLLFFINVVAVVVVVFYRHFILIRVRLLELHFGFYLWASVSINRVRFSIVLLFIQVILSSKYNLIDFVDFA